MKRPTLIIFLSFLSLSLYSQERLKPGELYPEGSALWGPKIGVKGTVPENWNGLLPRDEEIFLLSSTNSFAEVFVFANPDDSFEALTTRWKKGTTFGTNILVKTVGEPYLRTDGILAADLEVDNNSTGIKAYIEAKCGPYAICLVSFLTSDPQNFEKNKKGVQQFMDGITFEKPSNENPYINFDWDAFLQNKQLITFSYANGGSKETTVTLCGDGTFKGDFKKSGSFKEQGLKGKKSGTWAVNGTGSTTKLVLTINKMGPIETILEIRDEKVFANGERYFVSTATSCK